MVKLLFKEEKLDGKRLILFFFAIVLATFTLFYVSKIIRTKLNEKVKVKTKVHGNSDDNCRLHIVYEIYSIDKKAIRKTLKYGISSQCDFVTKDGNPRPEYQIPKIQRYEKYKNSKVWYIILHRDIPDRKIAKEIEQELVNEYARTHNFRMPPEQKRPTFKTDIYEKIGN